MTSTLAPQHSTGRRPDTGRRVGYTMAILVNGAMLWVVHQLPGWDWPRFLTDEFDELLPVLSASFVASMVANAFFLRRDQGRPRAFADLVTSAIGLAVAVRTWQVFPFDFSGYDIDWSGLARAGVALAIAATAIGVLVNAAKLARADRPPAG